MQNGCRIFYTLKKMQQPVSMPPKSPRLEKLPIKSFGTETSWLWSITRLWTAWTTSVTRFGNVRGSTRGRRLTKCSKCKRSSSRRLRWILTTTYMCKEWHPSGSTCKKGRRAATAGPTSWRGHPAVSDWQTMTSTAIASDTPHSVHLTNFLFSSPSICEKTDIDKKKQRCSKKNAAPRCQLVCSVRGQPCLQYHSTVDHRNRMLSSHSSPLEHLISAGLWPKLCRGTRSASARNAYKYT